MGTLRQIATTLQLPSSTLLRCIEGQRRAVVLRQEEGGQPIVILDADVMDAVELCAMGDE